SDVAASPVNVGGEEPMTERLYWKLGTKLTEIVASVDEFVIENTEDKDTSAVEVSTGVAEAMEAREAFKLMVSESLGEMSKVNIPGVVGPAPDWWHSLSHWGCESRYIGAGESGLPRRGACCPIG